MTRFVNLTLSGVSNGMIYAAVALSLVLIWRSTRIVNFAQGGMAMITTFVAYSVVTHGHSYWLAFAAALVFALLLGAVVERVLVRPVENKPPLNAVLVTLGLLVLLQAVAGMIWGNQPKSFPPAYSIKGFTFGQTTVFLSPFDLFAIISVAIVMLALVVLFRRTSVGLRMRAAALQPEVARLLGVRVGRMLTLGWALAALAGALAGVLVAPNVFLGPNTLDPILVFGFTAAVIGGLDSPVGALIGGLLLGLALSYIGGYEGASVVNLGALAILIVVLMVRPSGLIGRTGARRA